MKKTLQVDLKEQSLCLLSGITFSQVPYWFPFNATRDLKLDFLRPFGPEKEKRPLIVWICGGAWITMDRSAHIPYLLYFAQHGYAVASLEYRMSNSAQFPAQLQDIKSGIRYLRAHAEKFGIDPERVAVMGESAGGYLATMTGVTGGTKEFDVGENLDQSSAVSAVVNFYGPTDFTIIPEGTKEDALGRPRPDQMLLGYTPGRAPEEARKAGAPAHITADTPPFFIMHGTEDALVSQSQNDSLYEALQKAGVRADYYVLEGAGHAAPQFYQQEMQERILQFLNETTAIR